MGDNMGQDLLIPFMFGTTTPLVMLTVMAVFQIPCVIF